MCSGCKACRRKPSDVYRVKGESLIESTRECAQYILPPIMNILKALPRARWKFVIDTECLGKTAL